MSHKISYVDDETAEDSGSGSESESEAYETGSEGDSDASSESEPSPPRGSKSSSKSKLPSKKPVHKRIIAPVDSSDDEDDEAPQQAMKTESSTKSFESSGNSPGSSIGDEEDQESSSNKNSSNVVDSEPSDNDRTQHDGAESSEEEIVPPRKSQLFNRTLETESSDEEEKHRRSQYLEESDVEEQIKTEEQAFSKATRRSIVGYAPKSSVIPNSESSDSEIIVEETDEEGEENPTEPILLSSTIRSPLKELSMNVSSRSMKNESSHLLDEAAGGSSPVNKVSRSEYEAAIAEKEKMVQELNAMLKVRKTAITLPDGGAKLQLRVDALLNNIEKKTEMIKSMEIDENRSIKSEIHRSFQSSRAGDSTVEYNDSDVEVIPNEPVPVIDLAKIDDVVPRFTGKVGMNNFMAQKELTVESLEQMKDSVNARPDENVLADPPKYLKVELMKHQLHAIEFMRWRETQKPRGGFLADDMGLGKTLTTISLILKQLQEDELREDESDSSDDEDDGGWKATGRRDLKKGGSLIVCPASLVEQWGAEIKSKTKRGAIDYNIFHGPRRIYKARELVKYDVVITSYQTVVAEAKKEGVLFQVKWNRIVLDEGHVIRNHKSKQTEAICNLHAKKRWVLTGTPIHNKEFDLYASIKFLRCQPFDELGYWKRFIEIRGQRSSPRVQLLLKTILLRRTKDQLIASGDLNSLPEKKTDVVYVTLNPEERFIYNKVMAFSQQIFANYLQQQQEKSDNFDYDRNKLGRVYQKFAKRFNVDHEVKSHEILTLLLRLRQVCCHPGLIKVMLDRGDIALDEDEDSNHRNSFGNDSEVDLLAQMNKLNMDDDQDDNRNRWSLENEVFNMDIASTKIEKLMEVLRETILKSEDKAIIVSQWTSYLAIIRGMLEVEDITYCELTGEVAVKDRNDIVENFNNKQSGIKVMLLSLTAGGVGLNLVGANCLFLMDLHWNPQLEQQAQDRIYRYGQKKDVKIYKFVCSSTLEEQIYKIQQEKLAIATASLTGAKTKSGTKLTLNDMRMLFNMI